eukprot:TRINITY_DN8095_c0_g1_i1.p1 TRINITY_DN8095_c0_g1~~TRINITY_DN8095_c0_g1_i1.p1  ORF type:complete len:528 (+),score=130.42 TRINITY_DN8095_c0_g1_i1:195-1586(+)
MEKEKVAKQPIKSPFFDKTIGFGPWNSIPRDIRRLIFTLDFVKKDFTDPFSYFQMWSTRRRVCREWREWIDKNTDWSVSSQNSSVGTKDRWLNPRFWALNLAFSKNCPYAVRLMVPHFSETVLSDFIPRYLSEIRDRLKTEAVWDTRAKTIEIISIVLEDGKYKFPKYFVEKILSDLDEEVIYLMVDHPNFQREFEREEYMHILFKNQRTNPNHQLANRVFGRKIFESKLPELFRCCENFGDYNWVMRVWFSFEGRDKVFFSSQQEAVMSWITSEVNDRIKARRIVEALLEFKGFSLEDWKEVTVKPIEGEEVDLLRKSPKLVEFSDITKAIQFGYLTFLQLQLINPFLQIDDNNQAILKQAVDLKRISSTLILLQHPLIGLDVERRNELSNTLPKMSKLIGILRNFTPNLNQKLIIAVRNGNEDEITSIMKLGADPHAYNNFAWNLANEAQKVLLGRRFKEK